MLSVCLGLVLGRTSLREVLLRQANTCDPSCDPPTWCGVATTLCAGEEETPSLVEKLRSGFRLGDRETVVVHETRCLAGTCLCLPASPWWRSARRWSEEPRCPVDVGVLPNHVIWPCLLGSLHPLALTSLLTVLRFCIYSILRAFTFLVSLIRIGSRLQVFLG